MTACPRHPEAPCAPGRGRCQACLDKLKQYQKDRRDQRMAEGRCVGTVGRAQCQNKPRSGKTMCEECADAFNKYQKARKRPKAA